MIKVVANESCYQWRLEYFRLMFREKRGCGKDLNKAQIFARYYIIQKTRLQSNCRVSNLDKTPNSFICQFLFGGEIKGILFLSNLTLPFIIMLYALVSRSSYSIDLWRKNLPY